MENSDRLLQMVLQANNQTHVLHSPGEALLIIKGIAVNPETPYTVLEMLSNHAMPDVLERIAENRNTPHHILARLAAHPVASVRAAVADNNQTPANILWTLAKDESADVRYQLAENCNLPRSIIESLASDDNAYVAFRAQLTLAKLASQKRQPAVVRIINRLFKRPRVG